MTVHNENSLNRLILGKDRERFKDLLRQRLVECGWRDQVKILSREMIKDCDGNTVSLEIFLKRITPRAKALIPDSVRKELLQKIKSHVIAMKNKQ